MAAKITYSIPNQGFEFCRDRIGNLLYEELSNQVYMFGDDDLETIVSIETNNPYVEGNELSKVQVCLAGGTYSNKHQGSVDGTYQYMIYVSCKAKALPKTDPATRSSLKLHRLTGAIRAILEDPLYNTLGFAHGFVKRVYFSNFDITDQEKNDSASVATNVMILNVELVETTKFKQYPLIEGYDTKVKLGGTNKGYEYTGENYL